MSGEVRAWLRTDEVQSHAPRAPLALSKACSTQSTRHPEDHTFTLTRLLQFPRQSSAHKQWD